MIDTTGRDILTPSVVSPSQSIAVLFIVSLSTVYRIESLHPPGYPAHAAVPEDTIKGTLIVMQYSELRTHTTRNYTIRELVTLTSHSIFYELLILYC